MRVEGGREKWCDFRVGLVRIYGLKQEGG